MHQHLPTSYILARIETQIKPTSTTIPIQEWIVYLRTKRYILLTARKPRNRRWARYNCDLGLRRSEQPKFCFVCICLQIIHRSIPCSTIYHSKSITLKQRSWWCWFRCWSFCNHELTQLVGEPNRLPENVNLYLNILQFFLISDPDKYIIFEMHL